MPTSAVEVVIDTPVIAVRRRQVRLRPDRDAAGRPDRHRQVPAARRSPRSTLRNAGHIGRVGDWAEMAAAAGLVSIHFVNAAGSVLVAPFGGVERRFSTAPYCVGVPRAGQRRWCSTSRPRSWPRARCWWRARAARSCPTDALIGPDGKLTGDPHPLYGDYTPTGPRDHRKGTGAIRAFGDHKGSGLAFMCEMLGGALTGNGATREARPFANGMLSFYVDPARFDPEGFFGPEIEATSTS